MSCFWANPPPPLGADVLYEWSPGMGKKSLIKSGDGGDAVLSLPPSTKNLHANEIALCESEDEDGVKLITKAATGIKSLV